MSTSVAADMVFANSQDDCETVEALVKALVNDGFTSSVVGHKDAPTALIATYEWPRGDDEQQGSLIDIVVMPLGGHAVAARLERGQWDTARWLFVGDPVPTIWALLNLPHPDSPDSPDQVLEAPAVLGLAGQRPMTIVKPEPVKVRNRAVRLGRQRNHIEMSETFVGIFFENTDDQQRRSAIGLAQLFAEDGVLIMPGFPDIVGPTNIALFTDSLFNGIAAVEHDPRRFSLHEGGNSATIEGIVTFTLHNGDKLIERFSIVADFHYDDDGVIWLDRWSVYGDYHKLQQGVDNPRDTKAVI